MLGTSNYVNYSRRNPKRSAKYVYHTGTLASSIARAGTSCVKEEVRISNSSSIRGPSFNSGVRHQDRTTSRHRYGKKLGDREYFAANQLKEMQ